MSCKCEGNTYHIGMGCCTPIVANADNYYTKSEVDEKLEEIVISGDVITSGEVQSMIDASVEPIEGSVEALSGSVEQLSTDMENKADKSDIPSLSGYATEQWVQSQGYLTQHQSLSGYATEQWVEDKGYLTEHQPIKTINNISLIGEGNIEIGTGGTIDLSDYYKKEETDALLDEKLDVSAYTPTDLSNYYTKSETDAKLDLKANTSSVTALNDSVVALSGEVQDKADKSEIPSLSGYATEQWVENQGYLTEHQSLDDYYTTGQTDSLLADKVATSDFNTYTAATATALSGKADTSTVNQIAAEATQAITALSGDVQTKADSTGVTQLNNVVTAHTADTTVHVTSQDKSNWNAKSDFSGSYNDLTDKPTIPTVPTSITAFTNDAGYQTAADVQNAISGKADSSDVYTKSEVDTALSGKSDVMSLYSVVLDTNGQVIQYDSNLNYNTVKANLTDPYKSDYLDILWNNAKIKGNCAGITNQNDGDIRFDATFINSDGVLLTIILTLNSSSTLTTYGILLSPESTLNKVNSVVANSTSQIYYPTTKAVYDEYQRKPDVVYTGNTIVGQSGNVFSAPVWNSINADLSVYKCLKIYLSVSKHSVGLSTDNITSPNIVEVVMSDDYKISDMNGYYAGSNVVTCINNDNRLFAATVLVNNNQIALKTVSLYGTSSTNITNSHIYLIEGYYD